MCLQYKLPLLLTHLHACRSATRVIISIEVRSDGSSDDNNGVNIALAVLLAIAVIGLVISVVIIVFLVVQRKQSRCVVTIVYIVCSYS